MNSDKPGRPENRRETVTFMALTADGCGVLSFDRAVVWVRRADAQNFIHGMRGRVLPGTVYRDRGDFLRPVAEAVAVAAETARANCCEPGMGMADHAVSVRAEAYDEPMLEEADGGLSPVPQDWVLDDPAVRGQWLAACSKGRRPKEPGTGLGRETVASATVWHSHWDASRKEQCIGDFCMAAAACEVAPVAAPAMSM